MTVWNCCTRDRADGTIDSGTLESRPFYTRQRLLSAMFDTAAAQVFREMGYLAEGRGKDCRLEAHSLECRSSLSRTGIRSSTLD